MGQYKVDTLTIFIEARLIQYGLMPKYVGFDYLACAIKLMIVNHASSRQNKLLYHTIAQRYDITLSAVEHGIRNLISVSYQRRRCSAFRDLFNEASYPPTNADCLSLLSRTIRQQYLMARQKSVGQT